MGGLGLLRCGSPRTSSSSGPHDHHGRAGVAQAKVAWEHTTPSGRRCYLAPRSPSIPSDGPSANLPPELLTREPSLEESERGADHFRLVTTALVRLEWLRLRHDGHLRARFCWPGGDQVHATWLEP